MVAVLALVRGLLEWVPRSVTAVGVLTGPLVLAGFLVGAAPYARLVARWRSRPGDPDPLVAGALAAAATLVVTTVAWDLALAASPRGNLFSAIGIFSNQAIGAWVSVALWTGLAAVVGHLGPPWSGFRAGGSGVPPALALTFVYAPVVFAAATGALLLVYALTGAFRLAFLASLPVAVAVEYGAWITDLQGAWGVTNGPELTLWASVLAATLFARNLHGDPRVAR